MIGAEVTCKGLSSGSETVQLDFSGSVDWSVISITFRSHNITDVAVWPHDGCWPDTAHGRCEMSTMVLQKKRAMESQMYMVAMYKLRRMW